MAELFGLALDVRPTSVPIVVSKQQDGDGMWGRRSLERVLRRVVDQDLCVDLLADLNVTRLRQVDRLIFSFGTHIGFGQLSN